MMRYSKETLLGGKYSKESIDDYYVLNGSLQAELTDEEWNALVSWCSHLDEDEVLEEKLLDGIVNIDEITYISQLVEKGWLEEHGNPYPFDKDGNNVEESND
jgi:hypothetical protein